MNSELKRTIIHEIGHFVSHKYNERLFKLGAVEKIELFSKEINGVLYYGGVTIPFKPKDFDALKGVINLPHKIAELVYGCYFQSLYLKQNFSQCFDWSDQTKNGYQDHLQYNGAIFQYSMNIEQKSRLLGFVSNEYFDLLKSQIEVFENVFTMDFEDLIYVYDEKELLDLEQLEFMLTEFLNKHQETYQYFIEKIKSIIDWGNLEKIY